MNTLPIDNFSVVLSTNSLLCVTVENDLPSPNTPLFCFRSCCYCFTLKKVLPFINRDFMKLYLTKNKLLMVDKIVTYMRAVRIKMEFEAEYLELTRH